MLKLDKEFFYTFILMVIVFVLVLVNVQQSKPLVLDYPQNVIYNSETNILQFDSLTLKQKIAQKIIAYGNLENVNTLQNMLIGGVYLDSGTTPRYYSELSYSYQNEALIPLFVAADMEGCRNPFESFQLFPTFNEINSVEEAYQVGLKEGELLNNLGFNMNLAPVVDLEDTIWGCRSFSGNVEEVSAKADAYIKGLAVQGIKAVAKHYPGKTLVIHDTHNEIAFAKIEETDLTPFQESIKNNVDGIMISHLIVDGVVSSKLKPGVVSPELISDLRNQFTGLIISDEIGMLGLRKFYTNDNGITDYQQMFIDVINSGNDLVLTFDRDAGKVYFMIELIAEAVEKGEISEEQIDISVKRILKAKGIEVI